MGSLKEGRKALLLVSEGYSNMLPPNARSERHAARRRQCRRWQPAAGTNDRTKIAPHFSPRPSSKRYARGLCRGQSQQRGDLLDDPRGLATNEFGIDQNIGMQTDSKYLSSTMDTLRQLSKRATAARL